MKTMSDELSYPEDADKESMEEYVYLLEKFTEQFDTLACSDLLLLLNQCEDSFDTKPLFTLLVDHMLAK